VLDGDHHHSTILRDFVPLEDILGSQKCDADVVGAGFDGRALHTRGPFVGIASAGLFGDGNERFVERALPIAVVTLLQGSRAA
jgi:hypothetical protein